MDTSVKKLHRRLVVQSYEATMIGGNKHKIELSWRDDKLEAIKLHNVQGEIVTTLSFEEWEAINMVMKFYMDSNDG